MIRMGEILTSWLTVMERKRLCPIKLMIVAVFSLITWRIRDPRLLFPTPLKLNKVMEIGSIARAQKVIPFTS